MRTTAEEKQKIREHILVQAIPFLKKSGLDGAPVDQIMKHVGLTSGALYSHFQSKDDLCAQALLAELDRMIESQAEKVRTLGPGALPDLIESYLSEKHVTEVGRGCVFVALGSDLQRQRAKVRGQYEQKMKRLFTVLASSLPDGEKQAVAKVSLIFSTLIGALVLARSMSDKESSNEFLQSTKQQLLRMI